MKQEMIAKEIRTGRNKIYLPIGMDLFQTVCISQ